MLSPLEDHCPSLDSTTSATPLGGHGRCARQCCDGPQCARASLPISDTRASFGAALEAGRTNIRARIGRPRRHVATWQRGNAEVASAVNFNFKLSRVARRRSQWQCSRRLGRSPQAALHTMLPLSTEGLRA